MHTNLQIINELKEFLMQASTQNEKYCHGAAAFTRHRILDFSTVALFITNLIKKSLAIELAELFDFVYHKNPVPTKGAFSQARYKLKALFFRTGTIAL